MEPLEERTLLSLNFIYPALPLLVVGADVNASSQGGTQSEVGVAVNPTNPLNLAAVANNNSNLSQVAAYFSTNGGINWTASFITSADDGQGAGDTRFDPNVAFDSDGNVYTVYSLNTGAASRLMVVRSTDGGQNWTQAATVTTDAGNSNIHTAMITTRADPSGADDVLVTYARVVPNEEIEAALSLDGGATFTVFNGMLNDANQRTFMPWAVADENGDFHVTWEVNLAGKAPEGRLFHDVLDSVTLASGADGTVSDLMLTDFDEADSKIPAQPNRGIFSVSTVDVDQSGGPFDGRVYAAYSDRVDVTSDDVDIFVRSSSNNGATWSAPAQVNDDSTLTSQFMPRMGIDQTTGAIFVAWYDARNDTVNNRAVDIYAAVSTDGGATWSPNTRVTTEESDVAIPGNDSNDYTEYLGLTVRQGAAYVTWTDKRASNFTANVEDVFVGLVSQAGQTVDIQADLSGVPTDDDIRVRLDPSSTFVQVFINDPGYAGVPYFTGALAAVERLNVAGLGGNDTLTVDYVNGDPIPVGGLFYDGQTQSATPGDSLVVAGTGVQHGFYSPSGINPGEGRVEVDGKTIAFTGLEPALVSGFFEFTLVTPNSNDVLTVDSPAAGQNRVSGTSGGVAFEAVTFDNVNHFKIDSATNDDPLANPNDTITFTADLVATGLQSFTVDSGDGNDVVVATTVTVLPLTLLGGDGDDALTGGGGGDRIEGGAGDDTIVGGPGADRLFGGDGSDLFTWIPGDGSDLLEGGTGADELIFVGSGAANRIELFGGGNNFLNPTFGTAGDANRAIVALNSTAFLTAAVFVDTAEVEAFTFDALGGADEIVINNQVPNSSTAGGFLQSGTDLAATNVKSVAVLTGSTDGAADRVEVHGNTVADDLAISPVGLNFALGPVDVAGFAYSVRINQSLPADGDLLIVRGQAGNDSIKAVAGTENRINIRLDGDDGDDYLSADAILNGGAGNDLLEGGAGNDTMDGGDGDDTFIGNGGTDTVTGGNGFDTILVAGTDGPDTISVAEAAGVHTVTVNSVVTTYAAGSTFERLLVDAGDGNDTITASGAVVGLVVEAGAGNDTVNASTATTAVTLFGNEGEDDLTAARGGGLLDGGDGDDTFRAAGGLTGTLLVSGGDPSASDVLFLTGAAATVENVSVAPDAVNPTQQDINGLGATINVTGVELIRYNGADFDDTLTVNPGAGDHAVRVADSVNSPFDRVTSDALPIVEFTDLLNFLLAPTGFGNNVVTFVTAQLAGAVNYQTELEIADTLAIEGADGDADVFVVTNPVVGVVAITDQTGSFDTVTDLGTLGGPGRVLINGLGGDDLVIVDVNAGLIRVPITYDGGANSDTLLIVGDPAAAEDNDLDQVEYMPGPDVLEGRLLYDLDWTTPDTHEMTIDFINLEPIVDMTVANVAVTVYGTNADNAINFIEGPHSGLLDPIFNPTGVTTGLVSIDAYETFEFANKNDVLEIISLAGDDVVNLNYQNAIPPAALDRIWVEGNDPTASDTVIVNGTTGLDTITVDQFTVDGARVTGAQPIPVTITTAEHLLINGQGGDDDLIVTTPAGGHLIVLDDGPLEDAGSIEMRAFGGGALLPLSFSQLGFSGTLTFDDAGAARVDELVFNALDPANTNAVFNVDSAGTIILVSLSSPLPDQELVDVLTPSIDVLRLNGFEGDDVFNISGAVPFSAIFLGGGDPSGSDVANLIGNGVAAMAVNNLGNVDGSNSTVTGGGLGIVTLSGVEIANVNAAGTALTVNGTTGDDFAVVTPTGTNTGTIQANALAPVVNFSTTGTVLVDLLTGTNDLSVRGTDAGETITVTGSAVTVGARKTINYANVQNVNVFALAGNDTIDVTPSASTSVFVDGGDPIGSTPGDTIVLHPPGAFAIEAGPENDEGGLNAAGVQRVSWDHIEGVTVVGGGPALVLGTNGDDDITIIARDASTHPILAAFTPGIQDFTVSVNAGMNILFINVAMLYVDALAGDDDIVLREPAPNNAIWDVDVTIAGGPPASPTGDQGDVFEMETPGNQTVIFTPTGIDTATLNDTTNSSLITLTNLFTIPAIPYISSPGGIEQVIYDGQAGADNLTVQGTAGADTFVHAPALLDDAGTFRVNSLLGLDYRNLGVSSLLTVDGLTGINTLVAEGTTANDLFTVDATTGTVRLNSRLPIDATAIQNLKLVGLTGDDTFQLNGLLPYANTTVEGDEPSGSDIVNLVGAIGLVTVDLADSTVPYDTTVTGYGGVVVLTGVEVANLDAAGFGMTVNGTAHDDVITYTPSGPSAGTFQADGLNTVFNFTTVTGTFLITGGIGAVGTVGNVDSVILKGTNARDRIVIDQGARTAQVFAYNVNPLKTVTLDQTVQVLSAMGLLGQDTFQVVPAAGVAAYAGDVSGINNLLVYVDGGSSSSGENNSLVVQGAGGVTLPATSFVVVNRGAEVNSGTVRVYQNPAGGGPTANPDINYVNVQVVSPKIALVGGQPNLLIMGPDTFEGNEYQANAAFVGSGSTLQIQHASIFPNSSEFPDVPSDNDYYRVVAQSTGTLDFQVYFRLFSTALLPDGGNLYLEVLDGNGDIIASAPGTFGTVGSTANARVRIPAVAGQSYFLRVFGQPPEEGESQVINGYDATIINTPNPVPFDLELSRSVAAPIAGNPDTGDLPAGASDDDTGRSQFDNVTQINNPTIYLRLDDAIFLQDLPGNQTAGGVPPMGAIPIPFNASTALNSTTAGFRIAVYDGGEGAPAAGNPHTLDPNDSTFLGFAQPVAGVPHLYALTIGSQGADSLADGLHYLTAKVQLIDPATPTQRGFGDRSGSLQIIVDTAPPPVFFGASTSAIDGIDPAHTDTGVQSYPATFVDRVTSDTNTGFWGNAEANSIVRVYSDQNNNGVVDAGDLLLGQTVAIPNDGTNAFPNGQWNVTTTIDLNNPAFFPHDGTRNLLVTAEDLAGNVSDPDALKIFIDTQGPQVTDVYITDDPAFNLFGLKPENAAQGPTPLVNSITIDIVDQPGRDTVNFPAYVALLAAAASTPGTFVLIGDANGVIAIEPNQIFVTNNPTVNGQPATATIQLIFAEPLPDDRFTLTINDDNVVDPAGNKLDGESNAQEPNGLPQFPSGNGQPGGDFIARFTVDSRPEIGTWSAGNVYIDTNGNFYFDATNTDATNRDIIYEYAITTDNVFAGNFSAIGAGPADGFDKLAAYGRFSGQYRWLIDTDNDGVANIVLNDPANLNALPIAGNFDGNAANGDEVGLFDGTAWYFDTNHDYQIDLASRVTSTITGYPIVGDFDGDGHDDLGTYRDDVFYFQLWNGATYSGVQTITTLNSIGVRERPVAADMDQDGIDDIGLWVPDRAGATGEHIGEWYFLISNDPSHEGRSVGQVNTLNHAFSPTPLGHDLYARFGNEYAMPVVGNFDPPVTAPDTIPEPDPVDLPSESTIGLYNPASSTFYLRDTNDSGFADATFTYGPAGAGWTTISGDWDGDGVETVGLYNSVTSTFYLRNANDAGVADVTFVYGPAGAGWKPIAGDWDGDGQDTIGLYSSTSSTFYLRDTNDAGVADVVFAYGPAGAGWKPIAGDWDSDGQDTIGLYSSTSSTFYLRDSNDAGVADVAFVYGPAGAGWLPIAGDWNGDGLGTIGLYSPTTSRFFLRDSNDSGAADVSFAYGPANNGWLPVVGAWNGGQALMAAQGAATTASTPLALTQADLKPIVDEAISRWANAGLDGATLAKLAQVEFIISDLSGAGLGRAFDDRVYLDRDAAGNGWFVDSTPALNEEFSSSQNGSKLQAVDARAVDRIDLLSVVEHELGHIAGFDDLDTMADALMSGLLEVGVRRVSKGIA